MIELSNVTFEYKKDSPILSNIDLKIRDGEFIAVLGRNGCGKSTLARHLNGLLTPKEGVVSIDGLDTQNEENLKKIRQKVGLVFQNPDNQIVAAVVEEDIAFAPENLGVPTDDIQKRVDWALKTVGMEKYARHAPHLLSGGQKQRVAIAGILAMEPDHLVLDEPTAMLDPQGRREILETLLKLNRSGMTIIFITHNMSEAVLADRVIIMDEGRILMQGVPREVFSESKIIRDAGLELPQICELMDQLNQPPALTVQEAYDHLEQSFRA